MTASHATATALKVPFDEAANTNKQRTLLELREEAERGILTRCTTTPCPNYFWPSGPRF